MTSITRLYKNISIVQSNSSACRLTLDMNITEIMFNQALDADATPEQVVETAHQLLERAGVADLVWEVNRRLEHLRQGEEFPYAVKLARVPDYSVLRAFMGGPSANRCRKQASAAHALWMEGEGLYGWAYYFRTADDAMRFQLRFA